MKYRKQLPTSKCQNKTIKQQLEDGVRLFNLQVAYVNKKWRFSHGLALYEEDVFETARLIMDSATEESPVYFQLYLDKSMWCRQNAEEFKWLACLMRNLYCGPWCCMLPPLIEGTDTRFAGTPGYENLQHEEHYWTMSWAKNNAKVWLDTIPLPLRHAKKHNAKYKAECKKPYLMLDFYEL